MEDIYHIEGKETLAPAKLLAVERALRELRDKRTIEASLSRLPPLPDFEDADFLLPKHPDYNKYLPLHNRRNNLAPSLRIICKSTRAVAESIKWIVSCDLELALRSGGHCFEGFSQTEGVVIDLRRMDLVVVDPIAETVTVGAGADLGMVYRKVAASGFAFAAGSCPTVGVAGHTLGGLSLIHI